MPLTDKLKEAMEEARLKKIKLKLNPRILLSHNIPQPLHGVAPRVVLGNKWWNETRLKAYKSTNYHCKVCGVHKYKARGPKHLEGHELYRINYARGLMTYVKTAPLCHFCHAYIHDGRLLWLLESRRITFQRYSAIIQHGDSILQSAGLERPPMGARLPDRVASWEQWRLIVNGQEFEPKHSSAEEQAGYYSRQG